MASRRSRLTVKPNLGLRGKSSSAPSVKPPTTHSNVEQTESTATSVTLATKEQAGSEPSMVTADSSSSNLEKHSQSGSTKLTESTEGSKSTKQIFCANTEKVDNAKQSTNDQIKSTSVSETVHTTANEKDDLQSGDIIVEQAEKDANQTSCKTIEEKAVEKVAEEKSSLPRVRSQFPKAKPNIGGDASRQRKRQTSVGHSDNEDEFKKHPPPVQRVVTVTTSQTSTPSPTPAVNDRVPFIPTQLPNTDRHEEDLTSIVPRRISRVVEKEEVVIKPPPKTRKRRVARGDEPPDKSKMTMKELIYWNPTSNPMKSSEEAKKKRLEQAPVRDLVKEPAPTVEKKDQDETDETSMAPQLKIGPDGEIILNEESLVVDASPAKYVYESNSDIVHETETRVTSASFRKRTCTKNWSEKETAKFFKALSCVGTDFSMMSNLFPKRSRVELKNKFKKEERCSKGRIDKAIREQSSFDLSTFDLDDESETENVEKTAQPKTRKRRAKKMDKIPKNKSKKPVVVGEVHSDSDEDSVNRLTIANREERNESDDEELEVIGQMCQRPTRSGRVPKRASEADMMSPPKEHAVSMMINGEKVVSTSVPRPPNVVRIPSSTSRTPLVGGAVNSNPGFRSPGFTALSQQETQGQINVNHLSPGQLVFVQSSQPTGSQVLHVYVVSPSGVLSRSPLPGTSTQTPPMPPPANHPSSTVVHPPYTSHNFTSPGQSLLKPSPQKQPSQTIASTSKQTQDGSDLNTTQSPKPLTIDMPSTTSSDDMGPVSPPLKNVTTRHLIEHMQSDINEELLEAVAREVEREKIDTTDT